MKNKPRQRIELILTTITLLILFITLGIRISYASDKLKVIEIPLNVEHRYVQYKKLLSEPVYQIVSTPKFMAFNSNRKIWIKRSGENLKLLSDLVDVPQDCDWYQFMCFADNKLVISAGNYSEEQREKDSEASLGGYIAGPRAEGIMIVEVNPPKLKFVKEFKVVKSPTSASKNLSEIPVPETIVLGMQSCLWDGENLYIGNHGFLTEVFLDANEAKLIEYDSGLIELNRKALFKEGETLWVAEDEGGLDGGGIKKLHRNKQTKFFRLLNYPYTDPDSILRYKGLLLTSSLAGLVQINEKQNAYIHYQLTKDKKKMAIYNLVIINNELWAVRDDGWVKFDLTSKSATLYYLKGAGVSNNIQSIAYFEGDWFIGTDKELVMLEK
jgi:hypothetical protein